MSAAGRRPPWSGLAGEGRAVSPPPLLEVPVLEGTRLRLEPLAVAHSEGMFELWRHPEVCELAGPAVDARGEPIVLPAPSRAESDRLLHYWLDRARAGTGFRWAAQTGERFVGAVGFNALGSCAEYAYHLVPRHWGAGLATEASTLALAWAFERGAASAEVYIPPANHRSLRLARRLGFEPSGPPRAGADRFVCAATARVAR